MTVLDFLVSRIDVTVATSELMRLLLISFVCTACVSTPLPPERSAARQQTTERWVVDSVSGLGLFRDERDESVRLMSRWIESRQLAPADAATREAISLAMQGKHPLNGRACGTALARSRVITRWGRLLGLAGEARSNVHCSDGACELDVYLDLRETDAKGTSFTAPIAKEPAALIALEAAAKTLAPPPDTGGGGLIGGLGQREPRREDTLKLTVSHADHRLEKADVPAPSAPIEQVTQCLGSDDSYATLLIEADSSGVARCEALEDGDTTQAACLCNLVRSWKPEPAVRWALSFHLTRRDRFTADNRFVLSAFWRTHITRVNKPNEKYPRFEERIEDASLAGWSPPPARLAMTCFEGRTVAGTFTSRWAVWFDVNGNATKAEEQKGFEPLDAETKACVARTLLTAQSPCPARAGLWAMADLQVTTRDPNEKQPSPFAK